MNLLLQQLDTGLGRIIGSVTPFAGIGASLTIANQLLQTISLCVGILVGSLTLFVMIRNNFTKKDK